MSADGSFARVQTRTSAQVLVDRLIAHGVTHVFCVPGESYLAVLDALYDAAIEVIVCRQEGGAAFMAEAYGKATGKPGVCFVTRGPGATNASAGVHVAQQDSTPLILFVGQVDQAVRGRESFQEMDYAQVFGSMSKWAAELDDPGRTAEYVDRAFATAASGRPGPVVLALPKNVLTEKAESAERTPKPVAETAPGAGEMARLRSMLLAAKRPMLLIGGSRWDEDARAAIHRFAERFDVPSADELPSPRAFVRRARPALRRRSGPGAQSLRKLVARVKAADLVIAVGTRISEITSQGYSIFATPNAAPGVPLAKLVHVHPGAEELGRVFATDLAIHATPCAFAAALDTWEAPDEISWREHTRDAHADHLAWTGRATPQPGDVNLGEIMIWLRETLPMDAVICNGSGNFAAWIHRFYRFREFGTHLASTSASMGYGVPAAVAMQAIDRSRTVVSINGDGDFLMNGQEFATAVQYNLPITVLVFDNGVYGTIRMHQERAYPGRVSGTTLKNPDFAAYARAFGGFGATVERTEDFPAAFEAARASCLPSIVHVKFDPDGISPSTTLSAIRRRSASVKGLSPRPPRHRLRMRVGPVELARFAHERAGLELTVVDLGDGDDLVVVAAGEDLVGVVEVFVLQGLFHHAHARLAQQADDALARDAVQERAVGRGRVDHAVLGHGDVGVGEFGDGAHGVAHQAVVETAAVRLGERAGAVRIEASGLSVDRRVFDRRAAERRNRDRARPRLHHLRFIDAQRPARGRGIVLHPAAGQRQLGPVHRAEVEFLFGVELGEAFVGELDPAFDADLGLQQEVFGRLVEVRAMYADRGRA